MALAVRVEALVAGVVHLTLKQGDRPAPAPRAA
jgi:hypothetical protein